MGDQTRATQESASWGDPRDDECLLSVTGIETQVRRGRLRAEAGQNAPILSSVPGGETPVADQPQNRLPVHEGTANEAINRWEDDGGGQTVHMSRDRPVFRAVTAAGLVAVLAALTVVSVATWSLMQAPAITFSAAGAIDQNTSVDDADVL